MILAVFGKKYFSSLEKFVFGFASSIIIIDFLMLFIGRIKIPITRASLLLVIALFCGTCYFIYRKKSKLHCKENVFPQKFSKFELIAILTILFLTIFIKTIYLGNAILPTSTDLGHHMYWTKVIEKTGQLPKYEESDVTENLSISEPEPIADFIIGEHLVFAATGIISGLDVVSYFPAIILYFIHIAGILTMFLLTLLLFKDSSHKNLIAIISLFLLGPAHGLSSPQMKFVSGGVIGNTIGNLLIPFAIYFFVRAFNEKSSKLLAYASFAALGLAYTHHLSTFVFIFIFLFSAIFFAILTLAGTRNFKKIVPHLHDWSKIIFTPSVLSILALGVIFITLIYTPTYLNVKAVDTAVGAPSKTTRMGLTFDQLKFTAGEARFFFGLIGILFLVMKRKSLEYGNAFLLGWSVSIIMMALKPNLLLIDIPSNRIASYIVFPITILASYAFVVVISSIKNFEKQYISSQIIITSFLLILIFASSEGFRDNSQTLNLDSSPKSTLQTYNASSFLAKNSGDSDMILKDHNYLTADSWIKTFFMRGYNYPLSRGFFKRYEDETKKREQCTLLMISLPNSPMAEKCFEGTKTNFLMINPKYDAAQFQKSFQFWQIYSADDVSIFYKKS